MKILFLSRLFPYPAVNGGKLRVYNLLRGLANRHDVTLIAFNDQPDEDPDVQGLKPFCSRVEYVPWHQYDLAGLRSRLGLIVPMPRFLWDTYSSQMAKKISDVIKEQEFNLVMASSLVMASYRPYFRNLPAIVEEIELGTVFDEIHSTEIIKRYRRLVSWFKFQFYLSRLLQSFDAATVVSFPELKKIEQITPRQAGKVFIIPNGVSVEEYVKVETKPNPTRLIYSGSFRYSANYEAMAWFVGEIFPRVLDKFPEVHLYITGDHAGLSFPSSRNVTLAGHVDNIRELLGSAWVSIVPLKSGGGTRLKILEAMAIGVPVVATSKGAEGLEVISGTHLLLGDTEQEFADHVLRLLTDSDLRDTLVTNARKLVEQKYDWKVIYPQLLHLVEHTAHMLHS